MIPLGLKNTFGSIHEVNIDDVMSGYYVGYVEDQKTDFSGLMIATAEDVGIFIRALNDGSVFKEGYKKFIHQFVKSILVYSSVTKVLRSTTKIWTPLLLNSITLPASMDTIGI